MTLMTATSRFINIVSLLPAAFLWFQGRKMTICQRQVQSRFTGKCISLRNPWVVGVILGRRCAESVLECLSR